MTDVELPPAVGASIEQFAAARGLDLPTAAAKLISTGLVRCAAQQRYFATPKGQAAHARRKVRRQDDAPRPRKPRTPPTAARVVPPALLVDPEVAAELARNPWPADDETDEQAERRTRRMRLVWG